MKKVLITGSGGFIGHHLARYLKNKGYFVRGVDLHVPEFSEPTEMDEFFILDLKDPKNCETVTKDMDWAYNLAALNGSIEFTTKNKAELIHNNAIINLNMAEACWVNRVERIFYASSACVYPIHYQDTTDIHELKEDDDMPAHPDTEYGWEKLFSEHVWNSYADDRGLEVRIARFFNIYGPEGVLDTLKSKAPMALTKKVIEAGNSGDVYVWGDGTQKRSFCYIQDCIEAIELLMCSNVTMPVNLGTSDLVSVSELVDIIADIEGIEVNKIYQPDKVAGVQTRHADFSRAEKLLGWKNKVGMRDGMLAINKFAHTILGK